MHSKPRKEKIGNGLKAESLASVEKEEVEEEEEDEEYLQMRQVALGQSTEAVLVTYYVPGMWSNQDVNVEVQDGPNGRSKINICIWDLVVIKGELSRPVKGVLWRVCKQDTLECMLIKEEPGVEWKSLWKECQMIWPREEDWQSTVEAQEPLVVYLGCGVQIVDRDKGKGVGEK